MQGNDQPYRLDEGSNTQRAGFQTLWQSWLASFVRRLVEDINIAQG